MPEEAKDRRGIDKHLKAFLYSLALAFTMLGVTGFSKSISISDQVVMLAAKAKKQELMNEKVILNSQNIQDIKNTLIEIRSLLRQMDERQRNIQRQVDKNDRSE